jgi:hypothetical protein
VRIRPAGLPDGGLALATSSIAKTMKSYRVQQNWPHLANQAQAALVCRREPLHRAFRRRGTGVRGRGSSRGPRSVPQTNPLGSPHERNLRLYGRVHLDS